MDKPVDDIEAVRSELRALPRRVVIGLAIKASVAPSTADKFRMGHITELGSFKFAALKKALEEHKLSKVAA